MDKRGNLLNICLFSFEVGQSYLPKKKFQKSNRTIFSGHQIVVIEINKLGRGNLQNELI